MSGWRSECQVKSGVTVSRSLSRTVSHSHCLAEHLQLVLVPLCVVPDLSGCSASETNKGHGTFPSESEQMKKIAWTLDNMEKR